MAVQTHDYANIMLRTSEIDMTISEGRITSLYDVDLRYRSFVFHFGS